MLTLSVPHSIISFATKKKLSLLGNCVTVARQTLTLFVGVRIPIPLPVKQTMFFHGLFFCSDYNVKILHKLGKSTEFFTYKMI